MKICAACGAANEEDVRFCPACGAPFPEETPRHEVRKAVTVVFVDVTGSTGLGERLDPESLRRVMSRFFEEMSAILERHGGSVEKFIGDAVMSVFGVPELHEDDALRAVRAAVEMRGALRALNEELAATYGVTLEVRTGINTGEVVVGDLVAGQTLVTGDAVNVAARLEQTAQPGEILVGDPTYRLVRDGVVTEPVERVSLRGKSGSVRVHRLLDVAEGDLRAMRGIHSPLVGRSGELTLLQEAFELSAAERACYLFTILGSAGVGKSRLVEELLARLGSRPVVLGGRCLPYGEGITFWPVRTMVREACGLREDAGPAALRDAIAAHLSGEDYADRITEGVAHLIGLAGASGTPEETFWGFRRFLEVTARDRPVVVVIDDIHWGEPTFLDLIEYLADFASGPILVVCMGRLELLDARPEWGAGRTNAMTITLSPFNDTESEVFVENLMPGADVPEVTKRRILETAEGNPLFIEETVRMLVDEGAVIRQDGRWVPAGDPAAMTVPPTISALLSARLERLGDQERAVAERGSVAGKVFTWSGVAALTPEAERADVARHLQALVRRELITPERSSFSGDDAFRFRHLLIRDAAYAAIPKADRARMHERYAGWLEDRAGVQGYEELIGYHLERAYRYREELGPPDEAARSVAKGAAALLETAGRAAVARRDVPAAANLLGRAVDLLPAGHPSRTALLPELGQVLIDQGELARAGTVLQEAAAAAAAADDPRAAAHARLSHLWLKLHTEPEGKDQAIRAEVEGLLPTLERAHDERGLAQATYLTLEIDWLACRYGAAEAALEQVVDRAGRAGDRRQEMEALSRLAAATCWGPTPAAEGLERCADIRGRSAGDRRVEAAVLLTESQLRAMLGAFEGTRERIEQARAILQDLGLGIHVLTPAEYLGFVEMMAGDFAAAEAALRVAYEGLERLGERGFMSTTAAELAQAIYAQGRYEEAERLAEISVETGASDDVASQVMARGIRAKVLARTGDLDVAVALATEAADLAGTTDALSMRGDAQAWLAEVLALAGRLDDAARARDQAVALYERKGNVVSAARVREAPAPSR